MKWHYTVLDRLASIVKDGIINPAAAGFPKGQRVAVWFTVNPVWENTANKLLVAEDDLGNRRLVVLTKEQTHAVSGLARIGVDDATALECLPQD